MKSFFDKYGWIYGALYFVCIIGHSITEDDFFLTAMIILGVPISVWVMGYFALEGLKLVFNRPFRDEEWTKASTLEKLWYLFLLFYLLIIAVLCIWGIYYCINLLITRY